MRRTNGWSFVCRRSTIARSSSVRLVTATPASTKSCGDGLGRKALRHLGREELDRAKGVAVWQAAKVHLHGRLEVPEDVAQICELLCYLVRRADERGVPLDERVGGLRADRLDHLAVARVVARGAA